VIEQRTTKKSKMPEMKSNRKPTTALQYARRAYERCVQLTALLIKVEAQLRLDQEARVHHQRYLATIETQAATIARLLRQHDTLRRMPSWPLVERELIAADAYIAEPLMMRAKLKNIILPEADAKASIEHVYDPKLYGGKRCTRCQCLREANEASQSSCEGVKAT
jgi:hypothetical protein